MACKVNNNTGQLDLINKGNYKCCKSRPCAAIVCINCGAAYHKSCSERYKFDVIDDTRIKCCESEVRVTEENVETVRLKEKIETLKHENHLLRCLYWQNEDKNNILKENNALLLEKIAGLTSKLIVAEEQLGLSQKCLENRKPLYSTITQVNNASLADAEVGEVLILQGGVEKSGLCVDDINKIENDTGTQINCQVLNQPSSTLGNSDFKPINKVISATTDQPWNEVMKNKKNTRRVPRNNVETQYGTGRKVIKKSDKIIGAPRRKWIYVGGICGSDVGVQDMKDYLIELKHSDLILIDKLKTVGKNSAFKLGVPESIFEEILNPDLWPESVKIREFDFERSFLSNGLTQRKSSVKTLTTIPLIPPLT